MMHATVGGLFSKIFYLFLRNAMTVSVNTGRFIFLTIEQFNLDQPTVRWGRRDSIQPREDLLIQLKANMITCKINLDLVVRKYYLSHCDKWNNLARFNFSCLA